MCIRDSPAGARRHARGRALLRYGEHRRRRSGDGWRRGEGEAVDKESAGEEPCRRRLRCVRACPRVGEPTTRRDVSDAASPPVAGQAVSGVGLTADPRHGRILKQGRPVASCSDVMSCDYFLEYDLLRCRTPGLNGSSTRNHCGAARRHRFRRRGHSAPNAVAASGIQTTVDGGAATCARGSPAADGKLVPSPTSMRMRAGADVDAGHGRQDLGK